MNWHDLLFMHWPIPVSSIRPLVPPSLEIETFDGSAWLGIVPFRMTGVRHRLMPGIVASRFPEINVRTYVRHEGKAGVWFFSLDAADWIAVQVARRFYHLPYRYAQMSAHQVDGTIHYSSRRSIAAGEMKAEFVSVYRPIAPVFHAAGDSLEHFLTERYCLFSEGAGGRIYRGDIHHEPWPLQNAEAEVRINSMTVPLGLKIPDTRPILHFAAQLKVVAWPLSQCE